VLHGPNATRVLCSHLPHVHPRQARLDRVEVVVAIGCHQRPLKGCLEGRSKHAHSRAYHTQRISKNIVHCDATATLEKISGVKARLSNILGSWRNAGS
jgi:hypothetical protein